MDNLRIVSWNCSYEDKGFNDKKRETVEKLNPDILVVQEYRSIDWEKTHDNATTKFHSDKIDGDGDRELGVFVQCYNDDYTIEKASCFDDFKEFRYVLPYEIKSKTGNLVFSLFAVWTKGGYENYHIPVYKVLESHKDSIKAPCVFIGDFNTGSNQGSQNEHWYNDLKKAFTERGMKNCAGQQEWCPTFFRGNGSWLDDHCFVSSDIAVVSFEIGKPDYWRGLSDHCPIIVDLKLS